MKCNMDCFNCPYPDCINDYVRPYDAERRKTHYQKENERRKQQRAERKANGICTVCGKKPISKDCETMCVECLLKHRRESLKRGRKNGEKPRELLDGISLCKKCGKAKPVEGYKLCENCLEKARMAVSIGRSRVKDNWFKKSHDFYAKNV